MRRYGLLLCALSAVASAQIVREGISYVQVPTASDSSLFQLSYDGRDLIAEGQVISRGDQRYVAAAPSLLSGRYLYGQGGYSGAGYPTVVYDANTYAPIRSFLSPDNATPVAASTGGQRILYRYYDYSVLDAASGKVVGRFTSVRPSPRAIGGARIFVLSGPEVHDLSGKRLWNDVIGGEFDLAPDGKTIVSLSQGWIIASDAATGRRVWSKRTKAATEDSVRINATSDAAYVIEPRTDTFGYQVSGFRLRDGVRLTQAAPVEGGKILSLARGTNELLIAPSEPDAAGSKMLRVVRVRDDGALLSEEPFGYAPNPGYDIAMQGDKPRVIAYGADSSTMTIRDGVSGAVLRTVALRPSQYARTTIDVMYIAASGKGALLNVTRNGTKYLEVLDFATGQRRQSFVAMGVNTQYSGGYVWFIPNSYNPNRGWRFDENSLGLREVPVAPSSAILKLAYGRLFALCTSPDGHSLQPQPELYDVVDGTKVFSTTGAGATFSNGAMLVVKSIYPPYKSAVYRIVSAREVRLVTGDLGEEAFGTLSNDGRRLYRGLTGYYDTIAQRFVPSGLDDAFSGNSYLMAFPDPRYMYYPYGGLRTFAYLR